MGGSLKKNSHPIYLTIGYSSNQYNGGTRQPAGPRRHGEVTGPQVRIRDQNSFVCFC